MTIIKIKPFNGQHCETTATGCLINQLDMEFSEPMLFGLGEGLSYIFWTMKIMDFPFIGGRIKQNVLTENIARNLNLKLNVQETTSIKKAWANVQNNIDKNIVVALQLDCYHLEYFTSKIHFAGHYVAMYGYDDVFAYLVDTDQQGGEKLKTSLKSLELARNEKGAMSSKNLSYTIQKTGKDYDLKMAVKSAIKRNAREYLNPPIKNISYKGILKTGTEIKKWFKTSKNIKTEFQQTARLMEEGGTGGAIFRNLYRDFLKESYELLGIDAINDAYKDFSEIAPLWTKVSELLFKVGETKDISYINQASDILTELSEREKIAMEKLLNI
jgi:Domain of unknown function (DUF4872)/Butirosin biosynthesis protein H, N-terminal